MKHFLTVGTLAVLVALATSRSADAWTNCKFSVGLNWACQSGNNNFLWGLWHNGQIPEDGYGGGPGAGHNNLPPGYGPPYPPGTQPFPYFGSNQQPPTNMPVASPAVQPGYAANTGYGYNNNYYYPASYQAGAQSPYTLSSYTPNYYTPTYSTPSYYTPNYSGYGNDGFSWYYQR